MLLNRSFHPAMGDPRPPMVIFAGQSHPAIAEDIAGHVGVKLGDILVHNLTSTETEVKLQESIRGKEVYIIQSGSKKVNNDVFEMLTMVYACKTSSARKIVAVIPYLPYSKQCRMRRRACITSKLIAKMMCNAGINHLITMDLHQREIHGFFDCSVDNLRSSPFLLQYILDNITNYRECVMVAKNPSSTRRVSSYAERLRVNFAVIHGELKEEREIDGRTSPPPTPLIGGNSGILPVVTPATFACSFPTPIPPYQQKIKPSLSLVGSVKDKIAILLDDIIDDVEPWCLLAGFLKEQGALKVYAMATHGILSGNALQIINSSPSLDQVIITNTVPLSDGLALCPKIHVVDVSKMFAEAIRRIHNGESMSALFTNITQD
ncbi:phosphoribosyl pyrophosphate synthase-associated protein 2-like isoform X3 [Bolinopsis microptera]|uniref:phosphoribosyl pyrophosphate synthase-associated protein 2-like isoform X3 n=1 Tax=Bolinopsis microptera TaxID=2820187 RepID=UPI00307A2D36